MSRQASLRVVGEMTLRGTRQHDILIDRGGVLWLHGTVTGQVVVSDGGRAQIQGHVHGDVVVHGRVTLRGQVSGSVFASRDAVVRIPGNTAVIDGGVHRTDNPESARANSRVDSASAHTEGS